VRGSLALPAGLFTLVARLLFFFLIWVWRRN